MTKQNISLLTGLLLSLLVFAGGDDRDLGPVEVLDVIIERDAGKSSTSKKPQDTRPAQGSKIDTRSAIVDVKEDKGSSVEMIDVKTPVVKERMAKESKPVQRIKPAKTETEAEAEADFADKPVGHPTGPVEDIAPKIYETCEDMFRSDNFLVKSACAVIIGTFIVL